MVTFGTFVLVNLNNHNQDGRLTSEKAFVALSLFNILRFPLIMLPFVVSGTVEASVSVKRLREFLKKPELDPDNVDYSPDHPRDGEMIAFAQFHTHTKTPPHDTENHTHMHTCTHTRTHARTHARTHTHTHTQHPCDAKSYPVSSIDVYTCWLTHQGRPLLTLKMVNSLGRHLRIQHCQSERLGLSHTLHVHS